MTWMQFLTEILKLSAYSIVIVGPILFFGKRFFTGYIDQKSKNLATIEDIDKITSIVEKIKSDNAHVLEELKAEHAKKLEEIRKENQLFVSTVDKHLDLKIKIYVDAIEAFTILGHKVLDLCDLHSNSKDFVTAITNEAKLISRVRIVGSVETCVRAIEIMAFFNNLSLELQNKRTHLLINKDKIEHLENKKTLTESEAEVLEKLLDSEPRDFIDLVQTCVKRNKEFSENITHFVFSVRKELSLEINEEALLNAEEEHAKSVNVSFEAFIDDMQRYVN